MKLEFYLDYRTQFGEQVVLNVLPDGDLSKRSKYVLTTTDGLRWAGNVVTPARDGHFIDYYYSVERDGHEIRHEWLVIMHRIEFSGKNGSRLVSYDRWNDIPDDSYLYSSAMTECVVRGKVARHAGTAYDRTIRLKVRAPQLRQGEFLTVVGNNAALGKWSLLKAVPMVQHNYNEWEVNLNADKFAGETLEFKFVAMSKGAGKDLGNPLWENAENRTIVIPELADGDVVSYELAQAYFPVAPVRLAGTVVPIFSLRSRKSFGVGDFGDLKRMIDWVAQTDQRALQVLPINDTNITHTWTDSYPYNSISIYALHPQYADLNQLPPLADKKKAEAYEALRKELNALDQIDYERVNKAKLEYLRDIFDQEGEKIFESEEFKTFFAENKHWLVPYAAFSHYRDLYGTATFSQWPEHKQFDEKERISRANPRNKAYKEVAFWYFVQFVLDTQMRGAHEYARKKNVILKGDIPIGISPNGVEAWVEPKYFNLNGQAGAPPDAFSTNGQNWGFPTYNWDEMIADGCAWWVKRFTKMSQYFDAYRIDHVLGFFRIWEIPIHAVHGLLGQFSPALGMSREEIQGYGLNFQEELMTEPFIADWIVDRIFGKWADMVREKYLVRKHDDILAMKPEYDTQRKVEAAFAGRTSDDDIWVRDGLYALISNVLFVRDRKDPNLFHPRITAQLDFAYQALYDVDKDAFNRLYNDYYYRRNNNFWYGEAMKKLPKLVQATRMLVCAEDLGMVPDCVPWVMNELRILSLEIQSMPKDTKVKFGQVHLNPYRSVCTISTHDMPTLRQWWDEDWQVTQDYYGEVLWKHGPAPHPMPADICEQVVRNHLNSPSMLCLLSLQDWLSIDERVRLDDPNAERINIPANPRHYWRYRMHMTIEDLMQLDEYNNKMKSLITESGRK